MRRKRGEILLSGKGINLQMVMSAGILPGERGVPAGISNVLLCLRIILEITLIFIVEE